jgi:hypothetical protein
MIDQIAIFGLGVAAVTLTNQRPEKVRRWAPICGFAAEPFWFYTGIVNEQWGIVGLAFVYGAAWGQGIYNHWIKKEPANERR